MRSTMASILDPGCTVTRVLNRKQSFGQAIRNAHVAIVSVLGPRRGCR